MGVKTTNLLFYRKAETVLTVGHNAITIRGRRSVFTRPRYEVLVEDRALNSRDVKATGAFIDVLASLMKNRRLWLVAGRPLEEIAEAISDKSRDLRKSFSMAELVCMARLDTERDSDELSRLTRLDRMKLSDTLDSLQGRGIVKKNEHSRFSLTAVGTAIVRYLSGDPVFARIAAMLSGPASAKPDKSGR